MSATPTTRRPIKARDSRWAASIAASLATTGLKPNQISIMSVVFAAGAGACLFATPSVIPVRAAVLFVAAALCVQFRLLCNLFDGMVALEGGFKTKSGEIFNELPDRFADAFILAGCGYAARTWTHAVELGWISAVLAVITAYIRTLGASTGAGQNFIGPMAKQHRMAVVTGASVLSAAGIFFHQSERIMFIALIVIVVGESITIWRRTVWVVRTLETK